VVGIEIGRHDENCMVGPRSITSARLAIAATSVALLFIGCSTAAPVEPKNQVAGSGGSGAAAGAGGSSNGTGGAGHAGIAGSSAGTTGGAGAAGASGNAGAGGSAGSAGAAAGVGGNGGATGQSGSTGLGGAGAGGAGGIAGDSAAGEDGSGGATAGSDGTGGAGTAGSAGTISAPPLGKKFVGNIDTRNQVRSDFALYWNQFTPENAGKWGSIERTRDQMNWSTLDAMYDYAKQHNIPFKQHNFVWGRQQPSWLSGLSEAEQSAEVEAWIQAYCERYPDTPIIDVVNEPPPHTTPPYVNALGGAGSSGYDWIAQAFVWAHEYCPNAILILNDYNNIEYSADNARTIDIVNKIKNAGAPIHAVGAQAHDAYRNSTGTVQMYIDRIASQTGLPVYISEYDIPIADDNQQRSVMESQFTMFWDNENVAGITLWGYIVGQTWIGNSGLLTTGGEMRPAMTWLMGFLEIE
jgi:endo-1,4-beta-xylanase